MERVDALMPLIEAGRAGELADGIAALRREDLGMRFWFDGGPGERLRDALTRAPAAFRVEVGMRLLTRPDGERDAGTAAIITGDVTDAWTPEAAGAFLDEAARQWTYCHGRLSFILRCRLDAGHTLTPEQVAGVRRVALVGWSREVVLAPLVGLLRSPLLNPGEPWADRILSEELDETWTALLEHALTASGSKPSARWARTARTLMDQAGTEEARARLTGWLALVGGPRSLPMEGYEHHTDPHNAVALRGLIWLLGCLPAQPATSRMLAALAESALRKVPRLGPRHPPTATSAIHALARLDGDDALGHLARLAVTVTHKPTTKVLDGVLDAKARALGVSRDEVAELGVPAYGLTEVGRLVRTVADATAELTVTAGKAALSWRNDKGRTVRSPPVSVRSGHAEELAALKGVVKDVNKMLTAQSDRLDRMFLAQRSWTYATWRARHLDHPLLGTLARRLIWLAGGVPCLWAGGALRDLDGTEVRPAPGADVRLWHPIGRNPDEVLGWRRRLEWHEITQPFKQAHREVYLLTEAERAAGGHSARFAGHVLRQHQLHALALARGWRHDLHMAVDGSFPPATRDLPGWGVRAEFWCGPDHRNSDWTPSGAYLHVVTGELRFYPPGAETHHGGFIDPRHSPPLPLTQIPPLVFSEIMRDADLFVGVASVGADPAWQDGGPGGTFRDYWTSYGFGPLSATARTRHDLLSRLLPRLAIADRCSLDDRFLHVRGDLRSYKIHLGSGNILMSPVDAYLCIVPKSGSEAPVFLPFEGDQVLAVILSKAMMLAGDTAIRDPSITAQLR
ncbi:DUF4132 domain-containing protein [Nonomuraea sp. NPDC050202]|uniref:DUF4132 domain-containing protein n=1 Tax=Nonomuraea sp. NPDC050202 TaxID=3155035 RepID=UPI0033F9545E